MLRHFNTPLKQGDIELSSSGRPKVYHSSYFCRYGGLPGAKLRLAIGLGIRKESPEIQGGKNGKKSIPLCNPGPS
jgi:hypothetical protein